MDENETVLQWLRSVLREHPALLVSALYIGSSVIGMLYAWAYLRLFGINVFNYAQISDFLLASLKEPFTWGLVVLAVLLVQSDNAQPITAGIQALRGQWVGSWNLISAGSIVAALPPVAMFFIMQRHFIAGLTLGGVKG